ncbi:MAG: hypothetical protein ACRC5V_07400, partial [Aeromonas sp.]
MVTAIKEIVEHFRKTDPKFVYSMAPEVAYLISREYGMLYVDLLNSTMDLVTSFHPQYYNAPGTGVFPLLQEGSSIDCKDQRRFIPEFTDALIRGHDGPAWGSPVGTHFPIPQVPQEKLVIGLPSGEGAAGTGAFNDMTIIIDGWTEVLRRGYHNVKGFMTWSIDWDFHWNYQFKDTVAKAFAIVPTSEFVPNPPP